MKKRVNISVLSIIALCFTNMNCNSSEGNDSKIDNNSFVSSESDLSQYKKHKIYQQQMESPYNTNSFLIEHGGDPMFSEDSLSIMPEDPMLLFQHNHNYTVQELNKIINEFDNKNNSTLNIIKNTINKLNTVYNNTNKNDNNSIVEQFTKYINILKKMNTNVQNDKSLNLHKQQLIENKKLENIIFTNELELETIQRINYINQMTENSNLSL